MTKLLHLLATDFRRSKFLPDTKGITFWLRIPLLPFYRQARVTLLLRLATNGPRFTRLLPRLLLRAIYSIEIGNEVVIGAAVFLPHPMCIVLGQGVVIGDYVSIGQFVTVGGNYRKTAIRGGAEQRLPIIGSRVMIGPGAVIGGPILVGDDVVIGANAVITKDVPSNKIAFGRNEISSRCITVDPIGAYRTLV